MDIVHHTVHPIHSARATPPLTPVPLVETDVDAMMVDTPETQLDLDTIVHAVLQVVPGIDPAYLEDLIKLHALEHGEQVVEAVLHHIFDEIPVDAWDSQGSGKGTQNRDDGTALAHALELVDGVRGHQDAHTPDAHDAGGKSSPAQSRCLVCYEQISMVPTIQCDNAHRFCLSCLKGHATVQLGEQRSRIRCMEDCDSFFRPDDLRRVLPDHLASLFELLNQRFELKSAGLDYFEECPFCNWGCVMEVSLEESGVFQCYNVDVCGRVSCRLCKQEQHAPRPCEEADKEKLERHAVEEAMSRAVIRKCPNCPQGALPRSYDTVLRAH